MQISTVVGSKFQKGGGGEVSEGGSPVEKRQALESIM